MTTEKPVDPAAKPGKETPMRVNMGQSEEDRFTPETDLDPWPERHCWKEKMPERQSCSLSTKTL